MVYSSSFNSLPLNCMATRRKVIKNAIGIYKHKTISKGTKRQTNQLLRQLKNKSRRLRSAMLSQQLQGHPDDHIQDCLSGSFKSNAITRKGKASDTSVNSSAEASVCSVSSETNIIDDKDTTGNTACNKAETSSSATHEGTDSVTGANYDFVEADASSTCSKTNTNSRITEDYTDAASVSSTQSSVDGFNNRASNVDIGQNIQEPITTGLKSSRYKAELVIDPPHLHRSSAKTLRGVLCGTFGVSKPHSLVAYGPRHLSAWNKLCTPRQTDLSMFLPGVTIKKLVPLSQSVLGLIADISANGSRGFGQLALFNIDAALSDEFIGVRPLTFLSKAMHAREYAAISQMYSDSNRTQFISGKKDNSEVVVHSFEQKKYEYTRKQTMEVDAKLEGQVSALCHEPQNNKIISGSDCGQITLADAATGDFISSGKLANSSDDIEEGPPINNFAVCPTNPHVAMAACSATTKQIRIFDLRMPISTVLSLGLKSINEYSADIKPAWDPDNGVIAVPFNRHDTGYEDDIIVTADTRFAKYQYERPELHIPLDTGIWSISFDGKDENGTKKMVTAGDNGTIGIFDCFNICTYDDSNNECFDRSSDGDNSEEYDEEYDDYNYYEN